MMEVPSDDQNLKLPMALPSFQTAGDQPHDGGRVAAREEAHMTMPVRLPRYRSRATTGYKTDDRENIAADRQKYLSQSAGCHGADESAGMRDAGVVRVLQKDIRHKMKLARYEFSADSFAVKGGSRQYLLVKDREIRRMSRGF